MLRNEAPLEGDALVPSLAYEEGDVSDEEYWLSITREAYDTSTDFFDANHRAQLEKNQALFDSKHPPGSKYYTTAYKARTRFFRPKLRAAERKAEAAFASALFSSMEVLQIDPVNQDSKEDDQLAEIWEACLNHRLQHSIPWYLLSVGAFQKARIDGVAISRQTWKYRYRPINWTEVDAFGNQASRFKVDTLEDRPAIYLLKLENVRFDPAADWLDPLNDSPYLIEIMPMYINDVLECMEDGKYPGKVSEAPWMEYSPEELSRASRNLDITKIYNRTDKQDEEDLDHAVKEFEIVYVFRNIIRRDGVDWEYYTVGCDLLLSEPQELHAPNGRGYVRGVCNLEAHRPIPKSDMEVGQGLQAEANDVANLRLDNVKLVLNRRRIVQRNKSTDLAAMRRYVLGGVILTDDINSIKEEDVRDVTSSSYAEQDRLNMDIDDIVGGFSTSSVATNRALGETVGGMQLISNSSNAVTEFVVRTFVETWVEPVLNQLVLLMQEYENQEMLDRFAKKQAQEAQKQDPNAQPVDMDRDKLLRQVKVTLSVGFGNLDPKQKVQNMTQSLGALAAFSPEVITRLDPKTLIREVFSAIGYRNGEKFFKSDEEVAQAQQQAGQQGGQELQLQMAELELRSQQIQGELQLQQQKLAQDRELKMLELSIKYEISMGTLKGRLDLDMDKHNLNIIREMGNQERIKTDREEMQLKERTGSGI